MLTHLNVDVLFVGILNEESEGVSPHRAVGSVAGLQNRGSDWRNVHPDDRLVRMFLSFQFLLCSLWWHPAQIFAPLGSGPCCPFSAANTATKVPVRSWSQFPTKQILGCDTYRQVVGLVQIDGQDGSRGRLGCLTGEVLVLLDHLGRWGELLKLSSQLKVPQSANSDLHSSFPSQVERPHLVFHMKFYQSEDGMNTGLEVPHKWYSHHTKCNIT